MQVNQNRQIPLNLTPTNYHLDSLKFLSTDTTVASISNSGLITAKKAGKATISVSNLTHTITANTVLTVAAPQFVGLIGYYPFDNSAADMSGNGNNGIATNVTPTTDRFGHSNAAYYFNNGASKDSSWIVIKDNPSLRLAGTDFTINFWVNVSQYDSNTGSIIIGKRGHVSNACWAIGMTGAVKFYNIYNPGIPYFSVSDQGDVPFLHAIPK